MALDFLAGCVGGAAGVIVGHPLDTVKVRLQTQSPTNIKYRGTFHCLSTIVKQESVSGLYKGISSPLVGVAGVNAIIFGVYGALRPYVSDSPGNDALWAHFAAGSISGAVQSVVASPMELVKTRMQINEDNTKSRKVGPIEVLKGIYKNEGGLFRGVFKGWGITLGREIPGFGFYFASYEAMTRFGDGQVGTLGMMLAGGMAGVISWIVTFPIDVVKTRLQCDDRGKYRGIIDCVRKTYSTEGHRAFSRGLVSTVIRAFPTNAATFTVVTWIMRFAEEARPVDDIQNTKQYLDELLHESSKLQGKFEDSLRLKVPQYLFCGSSFASCSLASQCAASAQKYADKTQVYFNFYQTLQQQAAAITRNGASNSEHNVEEECVGVEKKQRVSLLRDTLAMHMNDDDGEEEIHINNSSRLSQDESVKCKLSSSESQKSKNSLVKRNNENNRNGDNAVVDNDRIPSVSKSPSSGIKSEYLVEREINVEPVNTAYADAIESTTRTTMIISSSTKTNHDVVDSNFSSSGSLIRGNDRFSHETASFPVQVMNSGAATATTTVTTTDSDDNDLECTTTGAIGVEKNVAECLCPSDNEDDEGLSTIDLTYLSKSLDIPAHIIKAASLQQKYSPDSGNVRTSSSTEINKRKESQSTKPASSVAATQQKALGKSNRNMKAAQAWKKYYKTPALNFCRCFEDHCVCYI